MDADARLIALAEAVADGLFPDWERESASASDDERAAIRQLQAIALAARQNAERAMQVTLSLRSASAAKLGLGRRHCRAAHMGTADRPREDRQRALTVTSIGRPTRASSATWP